MLGPITCERVGNSSTYKTKWLCQCKCSTEPKWVIKENLTRGLSTGCFGCYGTRNSSQDNGNWKGYGEISGEVIHRIRTGAVSRAIEVDVNLEDLNALWLSQGRRCALTGLRLALLETASLDRIDSGRGYVNGNVQWVHKHVNKMKNDLPESVFIEMCKAVAKHK